METDSSSDEEQAKNPGEGQRPAIDKGAAMALVDNDEELFFEIARIFLEDSLNYRDKLKGALDAKDAKDVEQYAHRLKGAAANIGASPFKDAAGEIELAARSEDLALAGQLYGKFDQEFQRLTLRLAEIGID